MRKSKFCFVRPQLASIPAIVCIVLWIAFLFAGFVNEAQLPSNETSVFAGIAYADDDDENDHENENENENERDRDREKEDDEKSESAYEDLFEQIGKLAMILGAISFTWFLMKKKLTSKATRVRKLAKWFYQAHIYTGWIAFILVAAHGTYFAIMEWEEDEVLTGLIAAGILLILAVMGMILKSKRSANVRKLHFGFALIWLIAAIVHTTDTIPMIILVLGISWGMVLYLERQTNQQEQDF